MRGVPGWRKSAGLFMCLKRQNCRLQLVNSIADDVQEIESTQGETIGPQQANAVRPVIFWFVYKQRRHVLPLARRENGAKIAARTSRHQVQTASQATVWLIVYR